MTNVLTHWLSFFSFSQKYFKAYRLSWASSVSTLMLPPPALCVMFLVEPTLLSALHSSRLLIICQTINYFFCYCLFSIRLSPPPGLWEWLSRERIRDWAFHWSFRFSIWEKINLIFMGSAARQHNFPFLFLSFFSFHFALKGSQVAQLTFPRALHLEHSRWPWPCLLCWQ